MHERHPQEPRDIKPSTGVAPAQCGDRPGHDDARDEREGEVPPMLPLHDFVPRQVPDVRFAGPGARLDEHPPDVCPEEAVVRAVRV